MLFERVKNYTKTVCGSKDSFWRSLRSRTRREKLNGAESVDAVNSANWSRICLIPAVYAKSEELRNCSKTPPPRPPKMRYKELPLYDRPHLEYKTYQVDLQRNPECEVKILHQQLCPLVSSCRKRLVQSLCEWQTYLCKMSREVGRELAEKKKELKCIARHPDNFCYRSMFVESAILLGFVHGLRKSRGLITRGIFWSGCGATSSGWLCFPEQTEIVLKQVVFTLSQVMLFMYNTYCTQKSKLIIKHPCQNARPKIPKKKIDICREKYPNFKRIAHTIMDS